MATKVYLSKDGKTAFVTNGPSRKKGQLYGYTCALQRGGWQETGDGYVSRKLLVADAYLLSPSAGRTIISEATANTRLRR